MSFVEDLTPFFADFGVDATVGGVVVRAIYDEPGIVSPLGGRGSASTQPQITVPSAGLPASLHGAAATVPGKGSFTVAAAEPDGTGVTVLLLERA